MAERQFVIFRLNEEKYALDINHVGGITECSDLTPVPDSEPYVRGLMNLRGQIMPIIDLKNRFGIAKGEKPEDRVIIVRTGEQELGFIVDDASQALTVDESDIDPPPGIIMKEDNEYLSGVVKHGNEIIIMIDLTKVLSMNELTSLKRIKK